MVTRDFNPSTQNTEGGDFWESKASLVCIEFQGSQSYIRDPF